MADGQEAAREEVAQTDRADLGRQAQGQEDALEESRWRRLRRERFARAGMNDWLDRKESKDG